ncbi:hypothetical protein TNIN_222491 [Trichonephila inaurata madagascariensis]|uniref:Uncharacterized protein n=1 Tax=Trichonephila inaurata madagascariensis TaxID=2747483 RepID=A0A8X7BZ30_9ARAC|nr:hypothetical protein TNIN_222491 [Trichonephila inaurata madagascariensis]
MTLDKNWYSAHFVDSGIELKTSCRLDKDNGHCQAYLKRKGDTKQQIRFLDRLITIFMENGGNKTLSSETISDSQKTWTYGDTSLRSVNWI